MKEENSKKQTINQPNVFFAFFQSKEKEGTLGEIYCKKVRSFPMRTCAQKVRSCCTAVFPAHLC